MPVPAPHLNGVVQAMSVKFNNLVYEMQSRGEDVIVLSLGEAFFDIPLRSFADLPLPASYHYSHSRGLPELRRCLADYYRTQHRVPVDPDRELIVTAGSKLAIHMALMATLSPGDEVLIHEPAWVSYVEQVKLCHAVPVSVPQDRSVFEIDDYLSARTRVIIVNNPNNPRGSVLTQRELEYLQAVAREHDLFLIADETYSDFLLDADRFISCAALDPEKQHTIVCSSLSKNYGMSGWRLGYVIANPLVTDELLKVNQHLMTCPATILQYYVAKHFTELRNITRPQIAQVVQRRHELAAFMSARGMSYLPGDATFYFFVSIEPSALTSEQFCARLLREHRVSVVPGIGYGRSCDRFVRVSVGTESMERTMQGISLINQLIEETAAGPVAAASAG
jgi:aspartate/methionine/tyrosine aminotransferase